MTARDEPVVRLDGLSAPLRRDARPRRRHARDTARLPRRPDRARRRRQVVAARPDRRRQADPGRRASRCSAATWPTRAIARQICPRIAYMPQGLGKNLYPDLSVRENIEFFARLFGQDRAEREMRIAELLDSTGLTPFADRLAQQAVRRHAPEARALLLSDPRSRSSDPRRADDRRRSALAPAVLGADRAHARAPAGHERHRSRPPTWRRPSGSTG